jgi:hypothetical protein
MRVQQSGKAIKVPFASNPGVGNAGVSGRMSGQLALATDAPPFAIREKAAQNLEILRDT